MMLSDVAVRRPVFAAVAAIVLCVIGAAAFFFLPVRELPDVDPPVVSVSTTYAGASAEVIENRITEPVEQQIAGIQGVDRITSSSRDGRSNVTIEFSLDRNIDDAANDVRDRVARVVGRLPDQADPPTVSKADSDASPIMILFLRSSTMNRLELTDYADRYLVDRLATVPGVAQAQIFGEQQYAMRIWLNAGAMAARGITVTQVENALNAQNVELPAGALESTDKDYTVRVARTYARAEDFAQLPIGTAGAAAATTTGAASTTTQPSTSGATTALQPQGRYVTRLGDIARVEEAAAEPRRLFRGNGLDQVGLGVTRQAQSNDLAISEGVKKLLEEIRPSLPPGTELEIGVDNSIFTSHAIDEVWITIGISLALVALVNFIFLGSFRAALIPSVVAPICLLATFIVLAPLGFSLNLLTLLALVLAIGLVVDDAIVVLENIFRHIEEGKTRLEAAFLGSKEIGFAVVAMTLTLVAVYAPLAFATGRTGRLFIEFALTLASAVLVSGFVALTLTPMMCSVLLRHEVGHGRIYTFIENLLQGLTRRYRSGLGVALRHRMIVLFLGLVVAAGSVVLFKTVKSELAPIEDRGVVFGIVNGPEGSTLDYTLESVKKIEGFYNEIPEASGHQTIIGFPTVTDSFAILRLKPWDQRERSQQSIAMALQPKFDALPGVRAFPTNPPSLGERATSKPIDFVIMSQATYPEMAKLVAGFVDKLRGYPGLQNIDTDLRLNTPELRVVVSRDKLADVGIDVGDVGRTLESMLGGRQVTRFQDTGEQYDVIVQVKKEDRADPADISDIYLRTKEGSMVQMSNFVSVFESVSPQSLNHFNRLRAVKVQAAIAPGYALGEVLEHMNEVARDTLPHTVQTDLDGQSREFRDSSGSIYLVFLMALVFIYLVLAAQFESWRNPLIIMFSVPLSMTGALLALWLSGGTLSIYSQIGLITLVGLITKHGILIVEFATQLRAEGVELYEAVTEASVLRLRPILMTTGAMVLGVLPLAYATGAGAESRQQIGWVLVGGLSLGTLLTLFVVPVAYTLIARKTKVQGAQETAELPLVLD